VAFPHGFDGFSARRIQQPDQTEQNQVLREIGRTEIPRLDARIFYPRQGKYALTLRRKPVRRILCDRGSNSLQDCRRAYRLALDRKDV
jgi:hypothetical protein